MKKQTILSVVILGALVLSVLVGCGPKPTGAPAATEAPAPTEAPAEEEKVLNVYNWSTYIAEDTIPNFEKQFGVKVNYDLYDNLEELYAKISAGNPGYDVIVPGDYMVEIMIAEDLLEPLNLDNIPNFKNIDEAFLDPPYDPGNKYSVPYQWGTLGIGYNIKATGEEITSWAQMWDEKYKGRIAVLEDMRYTMGMALIYLGYDPNTTDPDDIKAARDFLIEHKDWIKVFAPDTGQILLNQGEVDLTFEWSGDIFQVMEENEDLRYVIPEEGTIVWTDNLCIPKGAPHKELAETFINYILDPKVGADISNYTMYGSPNKAAQPYLNDLDNPGIYPKDMSKLYFLVDVGEATELYDNAWTEIKAGR
ncbi:MAG TPA: spermidine/putrescine ABC transporter substrate-binding protein [Anaerolineae bacterium]|nr:spermidine/putrescine ABC transporter substrate-binding protein [Anaerolineae bacterium]